MPLTRPLAVGAIVGSLPVAVGCMVGTPEEEIGAVQQAHEGCTQNGSSTVDCGTGPIDYETESELAGHSWTGPTLPYCATAKHFSCARRIVEATRSYGLGPDAAALALGTAMVETHLHNLADEVDYDSVGLFQQRASWGSRAQRLDPEWATHAFLRTMEDFFPDGSWRTRPFGEVCQTVQRSAFPSRYEPARADSVFLAGHLWDETSTSPGVALLLEQPSAYAPPSTTDVDGDGRADVCARSSAGIWCWPARDGGWGERIDGPPWDDGSGWDDEARYATLRMGDVDGDGLADVCARSNAAVLCATSNGAGFESQATWRDGLSDDNGWDAPRYYTTIRLSDVNGDGREDLCARDASGFGCWLSNGDRFDRRIEGPAWSDDAGWDAPNRYGTVRMGDVNGDRRFDVCARASEGIECWLADGDGFPARVSGPEWSDARGWGEMRYWSTIRLADVDGDGRYDVCARSSSGLACHLALEDGSGFGDPIVVAELTDDAGWDDPANYGTLRVGDVDGNGSDDLCVRTNAAMRCYVWDGTGFAALEGPSWSDAAGWNAAEHYQTIQLADVSGDGLSDLCARGPSGWTCHPSAGDSFGAELSVGDMGDDDGWSPRRYYATIMTGSRSCRTEMEACNGRDDDCDGAVDEHGAAEICNATDDDCDGSVDEGLSCTPEADGGAAGDGGGGRPGPISSDGGCQTAGTAPSRSGTPLLLAAMLALLCMRRRARGA